MIQLYTKDSNTNNSSTVKHTLSTLLFLFIATLSNAQNNVGIGTTSPNNKAILELQATDKGLLVPRLTNTEMLSIATNASTNGLLVYNTTNDCFYYWNNTTTLWKSMCTAGGTTGVSNNGDTVVINILKADSMFANYLTVNNAIINNLVTTYIKSDSALIKLLTTQYIKSDSAYIKLLRADSMFTSYLYAHNIKADTITAGFGNFDSLYVGGQNILQTISDSIANQAWLVKGNSSTNSTLNFLGTTNAQDLVFKTNNTEKMRVDASGKVGVGRINNSFYKLDIQGTLRIIGTNWSGGLIQTNFGLGHPAIVHLNAGGTELSPMYPISGNILGGLVGRDALDGLTQNPGYGGAGFYIYTTENTSFTNKGACIAFHTTPNGANTVQQRMMINHDGNVGINTSTPLVALHVATTDGIAVPTGTTGQQPIGAPVGTMRYNTTLGAMEVFNGTLWLNINTPPIGATYTQWLAAADPNTIYPNTTWISSDIQNGEFLRATGGNANVSAGGLLTGTTQTDGVQDHTHNGSGSANGSGALTTTNAGTHDHNWGGNWSIDDSRVYTSDNGDGNGNTLSDGRFWWGGSGATGSTGTDYNIVGNTTVNGAHNHTGATTTDGNHGHTQGSNSAGVFYSDPLPAEFNNGLAGGGNFNDAGASGISRGGFTTSIAGNHNHTFTTNADGNHSHNLEHFAHRHWIKTRPTTTAPDHAHTVPDHGHTLSVTVGTMNSGNASTETRPVNVAVKYWRRIS